MSEMAPAAARRRGGDGAAVLRQGFAKHYGGGGGRGIGLRQKRDVLMYLAAPKTPLYIGEGEGLRPHLGFPPKGCGQP